MQWNENPESLLSIINEEPLSLDGPCLLHDLVSPRSATIALDFLEDGSSRRRMSYGDLHLFSDALAERIIGTLAELEYAPAIIPVLLPQSPQLYITVLAILKAGKAFCPISIDTPVERIRFIIEDTSTQLLITDSSLGSSVAFDSGISIILVDHEIRLPPDTLRYKPPPISKNDLAYVLYTSGSTGNPKGVAMSHHAVTQSLLAHDRHIPSFTRFLQFAAPTFDVSIFEIFFPWYRGKTLVGCDRARMLDDLPGTIQTLSADAAELTPTVVNNLLRGRSSVPSLKLLLTIGEMLTENIIAEYGGTPTKKGILCGMYGPTEAAIHCTVQPNFATTSTPSTIGFPLVTVSAFIIATETDSNGSSFEILPRGEEGELVLGGFQIAEQYLNRPEANAVAFINHPSYGRLYRTGDRARLRKDGTIECLGRLISGQVKLHGQRVELGEIEHTIMRVGNCRAVAAMVIESTLVAFCAVMYLETSAESILGICKKSLPAFMVPSEVVIMDSMPQLSSGKVARAALETLYQERLHGVDFPGEAGNRAALHLVQDLIERRLKRALSSASNLALAGLDSLQSIHVASALRKHGYDVSAMDVFSTTTISELISKCEDNLRQGGIPNHISSSQRHEPKADLPALSCWQDQIARTQSCSPIQEAMLAETIVRPEAYCNWIEIELAEYHTYEEIEMALHRITSDNEILRSGFYTSISETAGFIQIVWKSLASNQIRQVDTFQRRYSLETSESRLRPLIIQVQTYRPLPRLLFQIHHALYDGWSFDLLVKDIGDYLRGSAIMERPQFQDVVRYYNDLDINRRAKDQQYWIDLLSDREITSLPNYNGRRIDSIGNNSVTGHSKVSFRSLVGCARGLMVSPQVFFQTATAFVLSLYTQSTDVVFGNVTSGRTIPVTGIEDIMGPCVSSLPFRLRLDNARTIRNMLLEVHEINISNLQHSSLSLREIARAVKAPVGKRLFDVLFVWQQSVLTASHTPSTSSTASIIDSADELEFKITLEFENHMDHVSYRATYDPSTIPAEQITNLCRQIDDAVLFCLDNTDLAISDLAKCFSDEVLSIINPHPRNLHILHGPGHAVEKWASITPEKEAIMVGHIHDGKMAVKETITYDYLNRRANLLANALLKRGISGNSLVAVIVEKSVGLYVAILAVLKTGCGYLPLVPDMPLERTRTILLDAEIAVCITDDLNLAHLRNGNIAASFMSVDDIDLLASTDENPNIPYNGSHLAYAVFTSGSTGVPKGVLVTQDNLMSNLIYLANIYPWSADSKLLQACSQAFDVSVFEIFFAWYTGMCLCTATKDDLFQNLEGAINRLGVTHLSLTPTVAALIDPNHVPGVEFLVTAGEAVTEHVRRMWAGRGLWQGYGPSETTNICTIKPGVTGADLINNVGKPFSNTSTFILDPNSETILPRGAIGELCFGGTQVFRGYLNRPKLNAAKIINHPLYGRIYRSGDMGLLLHNDHILFTGRLDDQVKIRGQRVELGEITSVLLDQDEVHDCTTLIFMQQDSTESLISFWVPKGGTTGGFQCLDPGPLHASIAALFKALSQRLPAYMIPAHLVPISTLPITPQGKIDKRSIKVCFDDLTPEALNNTSPSEKDQGKEELLDEWERRVAKALAETIGNIAITTIKRNTSFYGMGLDSISAIHLNNRLRAENLGFFTISTILKHSTIKQLANFKAVSPIEQLPLVSQDASGMFKPAEICKISGFFDERNIQYSKILPCTPLQEAMLISMEEPGGAFYNNFMVFDVKGDMERLQTSWSIIVERHDILRTVFVPTDNSLCSFAQVVLKHSSLKWEQLNSTEDLQQVCQRKLAELLCAKKPPLWLATIDTAESQQMVLSCHHALYDAVAISNLQDEVEEVYRGRALPAPIAYERYLHHAVSQDLPRMERFWAKALHSFEPTYFPNLTSSTVKRPLVAASHSRVLPISLQDTRAACRNAKVSMLAIVQATWVKLLHFYTGELDICFGNVVSGRNIAGDDFRSLVAPCFNTIPFRYKIDPHKHNRTLLEEIHDINVDSLEFQLTPLRRIQNGFSQNGSGLFDTMVILQQTVHELDDQIWTLVQEGGHMDLPLVCEVIPDEACNALRLVLHYHNSVMLGDEVSIVADTFAATLESIARNLHACVVDTSSLPPELHATQSMNLESTQADTYLLHTQFERNARLRPDHVALDWLHSDGSRTTWSFGTLNQRANKIAYALIRHNVRPEDIIPVHVSKSPLFYACVLGVLKAGAAFSPILPDLPESRKKLMLEDIGAKVVLTAAEMLTLNSESNITLLNANDLDDGLTENPHIDGVNPSSLAYCIFTSGSTGAPKGVRMEHHSPIHTIESSRLLIPWTKSSRLLQFAAITFDMCYYDCFLAWTYGITLCAAGQELMVDELPNVINQLEANLLDLTPSVAVSISRFDVPKVEWLFCIGEPMSTDIVEKWGDACVNSYGPTEAAFCTTMHTVSKNVKSSIIGKPFPSTAFAVFTTGSTWPLPRLAAGELLIGGLQLARDYLNQPKLNEEKFVFHNGQRYYQSGDIVRMLSDGNFEFIGRADEQVKIRGLRIELGEINHVLRASHPEIFALSTQIHQTEKTTKEQLVAFIVTREQMATSEQELLRLQLRRSAKDQLPSYMIPQFFVFIDSIPKSAAGKVDKKALDQLFNQAMEKDKHLNGSFDDSIKYQWTTRQSAVREVFARLAKLPVAQISPTITIYQLGLDSINAVQIAAALRKTGYNVRATDVMKHNTCVDLASHMERSSNGFGAMSTQFDFATFEDKHRNKVLTASNIPAESIETIRPCTSLQTSMISQFIAKDGMVYLNHLRLRLNPGTNLGLLRKAWEQAMSNHIMLRTGFFRTQERVDPFLMIHYRYEAANLPWTDESEKELSDSLNSWKHNVQQSAVQHLHQPAWRLRISQDDGVLHLDLAIFHALFDAQSLQAIFHSVSYVYMGHLLPPGESLDPVIAGILDLEKDENKHGETFWASLGSRAQNTRFPNMSPLKLQPRAPTVCSHISTMTIIELEDKCKSKNTTLQAAGIMSWMSLLSAITGEATVTCGLVLSGRSFEAAESAVFPCITTVPVTHTFSPDKQESLAELTLLCAEVQAHQHIPLRDIQRIMGRRDETLFDTIFAFQKMPDVESKGDLWAVIEENASVEYPVSIELVPKKNSLCYRLTFLPHVVPSEHALLILQQLDHKLQQLLGWGPKPNYDDPKLYSITPPKESTLSSSINLLHEFVEQAAERHPHRIALEFASAVHDTQYSSQSWTYSELNIEGNRVADLLRHNGTQPGDFVGICFDKCPEASFAILGVLKAGCAFVAIDPGAPPSRQAYIISDCNAVVVLSTVTQSANFRNQVDIPILNLNQLALDTYSAQQPILLKQVGPQDCSYCLYTSGTTGTPKGCEITHENTVQAILAFQRLFAGHWDEKSRWLQFASFHFDVSVLEQFWSWSVGVCVVSAPRDTIFEDLPGSIDRLRITHIDLTPSLAQLLQPTEVPTLCRGVFITGGESLKQEILDAWGSTSVIYNGYGPTEATIGCTMYPRVPPNGRPSNIGWQFDNVGTLVLESGTDVPVLRGGVGELCVFGKLVGKGYLNRPDLTARHFPYLARFRTRVYRTGDLVRILHNGTFDFLGRADDQVKLRGQRLEIGEINSIIRQSSQRVTDVATLVLKHTVRQKEQLVSFVVAQTWSKNETRLALHDMGEMNKAKQACQERLPPYMVPTHFVPLTSLPLNINNKADARRLRELFETLTTSDLQELAMSSENYSDAAWTLEEKWIKQAVRDELGINGRHFTKDTSFFELGMDSISVMDVVRAMKQAGIQKVTVSMVLRHSSIRRLVKAMSIITRTTKSNGSLLAAEQNVAALCHRHRLAIFQSLGVTSSQVEALAPCTPIQQGLIAKSLDNGDGLYWNTFSFRLQHADLDRLRNVWDEVHISTQLLRTVFVNTEDGHMQVVLANKTLPWQVQTLDKKESLEDAVDRVRDKWMEQNSNGMIQQPFQLSLISDGNTRILAVNIFHALYDGISIEAIFRSVWDKFQGRNASTNPPTFHSALIYGPLRKEEGAEDFWRDHLRGVDVQNHLFQPCISTRGGCARVVREFNISGILEMTRCKLNVTAQAIAQACWIKVLGGFGQSATTIGIVVSGRNIDIAGADGIVGPMFNTIPYRHRHVQRETWASLIARIHEFHVSVHPYQHTALRDILKWCAIDSKQPLFETLFVFQMKQGDIEWADNEIWKIQVADSLPGYPLAIEVELDRSNKLNVTMVGQGSVFDEHLLGELMDEYGQALSEAISNPYCSVTHRGIQNVRIVDDDNASGHDQITNIYHNSVDFEWSHDATAIRKALAELTSINADNIHPSTSIFELGLDSIDAIKLASKLKKRGIDLPVSGIMRGLSLQKMLPYILEAKAPAVTTNDYDVEFQRTKQKYRAFWDRHGDNALEIEDVLPTTPLQDAMVADMVGSDFKRYYNFDVLEIHKEIDLRKLREAWSTVVAASPILRTSFIEVDDPALESSFAQVVHMQPHDFWDEFTIEDEPNFPSVFEELRIKALRASLSDPLLHVTLVRTPHRSYLVLSLAHALYDGWSLELLHHDVNRAYHHLPSPRPGYQTLFVKLMANSAVDTERFWKDLLAGTRPSLFPRRSHNMGQMTQTIHRHEIASAVPLHQVKDFAKKRSVSIQSLGQAAFATTLAFYTQSLDVVFGAVLSGRTDEVTSQLLFPCMNTVAIRSILHGTRGEFLRYVQDMMTNIQEKQHFPLRKVMASMDSPGPLLEALFIYQKMERIQDYKLQPLYRSIQGQSDVQLPVCVEMEVVESELLWRCAVKDMVFNERDAYKMLERIDLVFQEFVAYPDEPVLHYIDHGISICGLPPFEKDRQANATSSDALTCDEASLAGQIPSDTIQVVRKALAAVSGLGLEHISDESTVFHLGLDSISAIKVSSRLRKEGFPISVGEMLRSGSIKQIAYTIDLRLAQNANATEKSSLFMGDELETMDYTGLLQDAQRGDYVMSQTSSVMPAYASQLYTISMWLHTRGTSFYAKFDYEIVGAINFERLNSAWNSLVAINPDLRTRFVATSDRHVPLLRVINAGDSDLSQITDITNHTTKERSKLIQDFALSQPWVHAFVSCASFGWKLEIKIHHAMYDAVSFPILMQQFQDLCNGIPVPRQKDSYSRFISYCYTRSATESRKAFWQNYLSGIEQRLLAQPRGSSTSKTEIFKPCTRSSERLAKTARNCGLSMQSLFLAAAAKMYATLTCTSSTQDVVLGAYLANRSLPVEDIDLISSPTMNLLPLRVVVPRQRDLITVARQIQLDFEEIKNGTNPLASLYEISEWTNIKVDMFVNFLSEPSEDDSKADKADLDIVKVIQHRHWTSQKSQVVPCDNGFFSPADEITVAQLINKKVMHAYLHAIDIEAAVRNGALDVGVFAPESMLSLAEGEKLIHDLLAKLDKCSQ